MATSYQNLSDYDPSSIPYAKHLRVGIIVSEWNKEITFALRDGAINTLIQNGVSPRNIHTEYVPGAFELTYAAQQMVTTYKSLSRRLDAIITLGCVVRGDTPHFDYVCQGVTQGITTLNTQSGTPPIIFGVLTTDTMQQAKDRAGGVHGNKGDEAAITAIKMAHLRNNIMRHIL